MLRRMLLIRAFEAALARRPDRGFQLLSAGEEAVAVGLCAALAPGDQLLTGGRAIGPALARGLDPGAVMAELLGRVGGPCRGRGGRGHLADPAHGFFGAHAVVGGNIAIAGGVALAAQLQGAGRVVACLFGDGACADGVLHETLNLAAIWRLPLLFVCNNNQYSVATRRADALAPERLSDLAAPFGIPAETVDGMDVAAVHAAAAAAVRRARDGDGPSFVECISYRFATHSTLTRETRDAAELAAWRARCPIQALAARLPPEIFLQMHGEVAATVAAALRFAEASAWPDAADLLDDVG